MRKIFTFLLAIAASVGASYAAPVVAVNGKLPGAFSVSASKKVCFSQGNLQYKASTNTWRFAENQYDAVGGSNGNDNVAPYNYTSSANHSPSDSQTGWIDLFGWAASGISRTGVNKYQPYSTSTTNKDYGTKVTKSASETLGNYDWGKNMGDGWRTLTAEEWGYLIGPGNTGNWGTKPLDQRDHYQSLRGLCKITVSGTAYPGMIILPDDLYDNLPTEGEIATRWAACAVEAGSLNYTLATFTEEEWTALQAAGAVFLPAAGYRYGTAVRYASARGRYWSSSAYSDTQAFGPYFGANFQYPEDHNDRCDGRSVRLVSDIPQYTITFQNYDGTTLQSSKVYLNAIPAYTGDTPEKPSTAAYSYTFSGWSPTIAKATANATYTAQFSQAPNQATVNDVIAKINAIGEVAYTPECKDKIDVARNAYNALTDEQKALVSNYATLEAAEAQYAYLTPVVAVNGKLPGAFSVSASKKVNFSQGNLRATTDDNGTTWTWAFAADQLTFVGNATANTAINGNGTVSVSGTVDLFGWSTAATKYGINNSLSNSTYSGDFVDWGSNPDLIASLGKGWRTLTSAEWTYLLNTRTTTSGVRYAKATVDGKTGLIVLPDDWSESYHALASANTDNAAYTSNTFDAAIWSSDFEAHGAVFLPAAGYRRGTSVEHVGVHGNYWSASPDGASYAWYLAFNESAFLPAYNYNRVTGEAVRLVSDIPQYTITPNEDPKNTGVYYSTFFDSENKYTLPENVEAYVAEVSSNALNLTKIAGEGQTIPADNAVILKSTVTPFTLSISDADAVTFTATNNLHGVDADTEIASVVSGTCYVLSGNSTDGVGFFVYKAPNQLQAHKAYIDLNGSGMAQAPRRMPFVFNGEQTATGVENVQGNVQSTKVIENGVLYIIKNGVKYNAMGQEVK